MRPQKLGDVVGQTHLVGSGQLLARLIKADKPPSMILWGPPGTGKTSLAQVVANETSALYLAFSAVLGGVAELRKLIAQGNERRRLGKRTILFVDEIHRFNKAQQDALLPHVENGTVTLIGATTENPSFAVNAALLSRARVFRLEPLSAEDVVVVLSRALQHPDGVKATVSDEAIEALATAAQGDARRALTVLEALCADGREVDVEVVKEAFASKTLLYDKTGEEHYNVISALHKSIRSSDVDAALYWLTRMLDAGEDRLFIGRRLVRIASEDIGLADPRAMEQALAAVDAFRLIGEPEGDLALAQAAAYLALAPKSDALYKALAEAEKDVQRTIGEPVPLHLRNAPTRLMKDIGYGHGYQHAHNRPDAVVDMECLPSALVGRQYYHPSDRGVEQRIQERLAEWRRKRAKERAE